MRNTRLVALLWAALLLTSGIFALLAVSGFSAFAMWFAMRADERKRARWAALGCECVPGRYITWHGSGCKAVQWRRRRRRGMLFVVDGGNA